VVDLSGLHFIDSSGLGCLLAHDDRVRREGGELVLRGPGPALMRVFEVTGAVSRLAIESA
jgi:stage II sporulation protein AA (anti-sigma F factor antagonist)